MVGGEGQYFSSQRNSLEQRRLVHTMTHCWGTILLQQRYPSSNHCPLPSLPRQTQELLFPGSSTSQQGFILYSAPSSGKHLGQPTYTAHNSTAPSSALVPLPPGFRILLANIWREAGGCKAAKAGAGYRQQLSERCIS